MAPRGNAIGAVQRTKTTPIPVQRTTRNISTRALTSLPAGKMVPLVAMPLLREDAVSRAEFRLAFEMSETVELLMNAVNVRVMAYLVPKLAFERFNGMDSLNRSYEGIAEPDGNVIPWFHTYTFPGHTGDKIAYHLGLHCRSGDRVNSEYAEAYNCIWNHRAANRSKDIPARSHFDLTLAPAFWNHQTFAHIVPDFDQAVIDGEVPLNVVAGSDNTATQVKIDGLGVTSGATMGGAVTVTETWDTALNTTQYSNHFPLYGAGFGVMKAGSGYPGVSAMVPIRAIVNEMLESQGITLSLSNIELARKTQAFAALRRQYSGLTDDHLIDLLMDGIQIPEQLWKQPMLLADRSTVFGMSKRYASDGASLTESVVNGITYIDLRFSVPRVSTGGVVMIVAEIAPEQLFERQKDPYWHATSVDQLPQFLRDTLDPEKVEIVKNEDIDVSHTAYLGTFGYAPLNWQWAKSKPNVGGKFIRPTVDEEFDEDRQRIWAVETKDPKLSEDFYLVSDMHYKPFVVTDINIDPFECLTRGAASIQGNTVFGGLLVEAGGEYDAVFAEAPLERIPLPPHDAATKPAPEGAEGEPGA